MSDTPVVEPKYVDINRALAAEARQRHRDRRERIATAALQGLLSNPQTRGWDHEIAARAVRYANALIVELNEREDGR